MEDHFESLYNFRSQNVAEMRGVVLLETQDVWVFGLFLMVVGAIMMARSYHRSLNAWKEGDEFRRDGMMALGVLTLLFGGVFICASIIELIEPHF